MRANNRLPGPEDGAYNAAYHWYLKFKIPANTEATSQKRGNVGRNTYWPKYNGSAETADKKPEAAEKKAAALNHQNRRQR